MIRSTACLAAAIGFCATSGFAQDAAASFVFNGQQITIQRDPGATSAFAPLASDPCGATCIAPLQAAAGVATLDETQVLGFFTDVVAADQGLVVDARTPGARAAGYIPGSVSLPRATLAPDSKYTKEILLALGARELDGVFNFADARMLLVYDSGPASNEAGGLVLNLLAKGYPAAKIKYYRGGMQVWSMLGFSIQKGQS